MPDPVEGRLRGKIAIIFGAGSVGEGWGDGKAAAVAYALAGARVAAVEVDPAAAEVTRDLILAGGGTAISVQANAAALASVEQAAGRAKEAFGRLNILHNNVGIASQGGPVETSEAACDQVMSVNVKSMLLI